MTLKNTLLVISSLLAAQSAGATEIAGQWITHPAIDFYSNLNGYTAGATNNIQKLVEGERYVYALVTSNYYYESWYESPYNYCIFGNGETRLNVARYDKLADAPTLETLAPKLGTTVGIDVTMMEYSQELKCLAIAYRSGAVDLLFDDGRLIGNSDLTMINQPGGSQIHALAFAHDGSTLVAAADYGEALFDIESGELRRIWNFSQRVNCANLLGGRIFAATDDAIHFFDADATPATLDETPTLTSNSTLAPARLLDGNGRIMMKYGIFPVDESAFVFTGINTAATSDGASLNLLLLPDNPESEPCSVVSLASAAINFAQMGARDDMAAEAREEALVSPTRDGLMFHNQQSIYLLPYKTTALDHSDPTALKNAMTTLKKPGSATLAYANDGQEANKITATYDGVNFHTYRHRSGLRRRTANTATAATTWSDAGSDITFNAPSAGWPSYLYYNPAYGIVAHNAGTDHNWSYRNGMANGLCSYRDGVWTQHSFFVDNPGAIASVILPAGAIHDPMDPKYVYSCGASTYGMRRQNLDDRTDWLLFTRSNNTGTNKVNVVPVMTGSAYNSLTAFGQPGFDNDGTMWTTYSRLPCNDYPETHSELWYWTADDRAAVKSAADYAAHPMKIISIPGIYPSRAGTTIAGKTDGNRNIIVHLSDNTSYGSFFYDHNGTPDDTSDDRWVELKNLIDENGDEILTITRPHLPFEDPFDGTFLIPTRHEMLTITAEQALNGDKPRCSHLNPVMASDGAIVRDFCIGGVGGIVADSECRKWIALQKGGLVCLSPDRSTVLAHFTTANSDIPSNELLSIAYNPETNSIFVGSRLGVTEFCLAGSDNIYASAAASVSPMIVESHYTGYVTFTGLVDGKEYTLVGPDGLSIELPSSTAGRLQWHPEGAPAGIYHIEGLPSTEFYLNR